MSIQTDHRDDKEKVVGYGTQKEQEFLQLAEELPVNVSFSQSRENGKDYSIDFCMFDKYKTDLKTRRTPFFLSEKKYGIDPQYAVTFNTNKFNKYQKIKGQVFLLFWVFWEKREKFGIELDNMGGLWTTTVDKVEDLINSGSASKHKYNPRENSYKNSTESYIFDLRDITPIKVVYDTDIIVSKRRKEVEKYFEEKSYI